MTSPTIQQNHSAKASQNFEQKLDECIKMLDRLKAALPENYFELIGLDAELAPFKKLEVNLADVQSQSEEDYDIKDLEGLILTLIVLRNNFLLFNWEDISHFDNLIERLIKIPHLAEDQLQRILSQVSEKFDASKTKDHVRAQIAPFHLEIATATSHTEIPDLLKEIQKTHPNQFCYLFVYCTEYQAWQLCHLEDDNAKIRTIREVKALQKIGIDDKKPEQLNDIDRKRIAFKLWEELSKFSEIKKWLIEALSKHQQFLSYSTATEKHPHDYFEPVTKLLAAKKTSVSFSGVQKVILPSDRLNEVSQQNEKAYTKSTESWYAKLIRNVREYTEQYYNSLNEAKKFLTEPMQKMIWNADGSILPVSNIDPDDVRIIKFLLQSFQMLKKLCDELSPDSHSALDFDEVRSSNQNIYFKIRAARAEVHRLAMATFGDGFQSTLIDHFQAMLFPLLFNFPASTDPDIAKLFQKFKTGFEASCKYVNEKKVRVMSAFDAEKYADSAWYVKFKSYLNGISEQIIAELNDGSQINKDNFYEYDLTKGADPFLETLKALFNSGTVALDLLTVYMDSDFLVTDILKMYFKYDEMMEHFNKINWKELTSENLKDKLKYVSLMHANGVMLNLIPVLEQLAEKSVEIETYLHLKPGMLTDSIAKMFKTVDDYTQFLMRPIFLKKTQQTLESKEKEYVKTNAKLQPTLRLLTDSIQDVHNLRGIHPSSASYFTLFKKYTLPEWFNTDEREETVSIALAEKLLQIVNLPKKFDNSEKELLNKFISALPSPTGAVINHHIKQAQAHYHLEFVENNSDRRAILKELQLRYPEKEIYLIVHAPGFTEEYKLEFLNRKGVQDFRVIPPKLLSPLKNKETLSEEEKATFKQNLLDQLLTHTVDFDSEQELENQDFIELLRLLEKTEVELKREFQSNAIVIAESDDRIQHMKKNTTISPAELQRLRELKAVESDGEKSDSDDNLSDTSSLEMSDFTDETDSFELDVSSDENLSDLEIQPLAEDKTKEVVDLEKQRVDAIYELANRVKERLEKYVEMRGTGVSNSIYRLFSSLREKKVGLAKNFSQAFTSTFRHEACAEKNALDGFGNLLISLDQRHLSYLSDYNQLGEFARMMKEIEQDFNSVKNVYASELPDIQLNINYMLQTENSASP